MKKVMRNDERTQASYLLASQGPGSSIDELLLRPNVDAQFLLNEAARHNLVGHMSELVERHAADINAASPLGVGEGGLGSRPPLCAAAQYSSVAAAAWLLDRGADAKGCLETHDGDLMPALWTAAEGGDVRTARLLLQAGADVDAAKKSTGNTALYMAVQNGHGAVLALLLGRGADPNKMRDNPRECDAPPVQVAVCTAQLPILAQLMSAGASVPIMALVCLERMRESRKVLAQGYTRDVSSEELDQMEELLYINCDLAQNAHYMEARAAERNKNYRKALISLQKVPESCANAQVRYDIERMVSNIYGVEGSDGRISVWNQVPVMSREQPESLQFYAWAQIGRKIYTHGGLDFIDTKSVLAGIPLKDEVWELDIDTRKWALLNIAPGRTPGPRRGHSMFAFKNALYIWGGSGTTRGVRVSSKLYRLDLNDRHSLSWKVIKSKNGLMPPPREEHAGVLYKGNYYITGGNLNESMLTDDLWCLDVAKLKWHALKAGPVERHSHNMWAANGKLYVLGGLTIKKHIENFIKASHSIDNFDIYDIEKKSWSSLKVIGDKPFDISEFTVLPLYHGDQKIRDDPYSIIVWGGYSEVDQSTGPTTIEKQKAKYGKDYLDFVSAYRNRMLRFDIATQAWTLLKPTRDLLPKAQSFAAELCSADGQTKLIFGGGYGFTTDSKTPDAANADLLVQAVYKKWAEDESLNQGNSSPSASKNIYEVSIADERDMCFSTNSLTGNCWAWNFFDTSGEKVPSVRVDVTKCSPTMHIVTDSTLEDYMEPTCKFVKPNDSDEILGLRVKLSNLKGRKDLNGQVGRCGFWLEDKDRYQIFLSSSQRSGPASLSVKASNLLVAKPIDLEEKENLSSSVSVFPEVYMSIGLPQARLSKQSALECLEKNLLKEKDDQSLNFYNDTYRGPVSPKAQALLRTIAENGTAFKPTLACLLFHSTQKDSHEESVQKERVDRSKKLALFLKFYTSLRECDSLKIEKFEKEILKKRLKHGLTADSLGPWFNILGPWLKIVVTLDGICPKIQRELIVSPDISMKDLHHQVLCPAIGWTNNYHCYAFRRIYGDIFSICNTKALDDNLSAFHNAANKSIKMMLNECWIGPKFSTALDSMFQPLYIGGALANDANISLGDLVAQNGRNETHLQYINDFGDWWSHTICVSKYKGPILSNASVAYLISGQGGCPPEDIGGITKYCHRMYQLIGKSNFDQDYFPGQNNNVLSKTSQPSSKKWWDLFNSEVRAKLNGVALASPLAFDLNETRLQIDTAIRCPTQKAGKESEKLTNRNFLNGLASETNSIRVIPARGSKDPTTYCAICDVTVALKECKRCRSVAYCSRKHQIQNWPEHKKMCKQLQNERQ